MNIELSNAQVIILVLLVMWEMIWKGLALWRSAKRNQPYWFIALLVINTIGILPIIYLLITSNNEDVAHAHLQETQ